MVALQAMAVFTEQDRPVSEAARSFEPFPQLLKNVHYKGGAPLENAEVQRTVKAAEAKLGDSGRILVRPSGTEPLLRVMVEGFDEVLVAPVAEDIAGAVERASGGF